MKRGAVPSAGVAGDAGVLTADEPTTCAGGQCRAYTRVMRAMHWGTVTLLFNAYAAAWMIGNASNAAEEAWLIMLHRSLGIAILLVTGIRLVIRQRTNVPPLPAGLPVTQRLAAGGSAISLYALPIVQPLLGLAASALHGDRVILSGGLVLPRLVSADRTLAHALFQLHGAAGCVFLALIGLHAAAALHHHFVRKDHVLTAMLPGVPMVPGGSGSAP